MDQWIPATDFIAADVIRWTEGIYDRRRRGKALRVRGLMLPKGKGIFTGHAHFDALERVGPPSIFKRFRTAIAQKFGR